MSEASLVRSYEGKKLATVYHKYRPNYPDVVKETILNLMQKSDKTGKYGRMLDVGCGSGQATHMFAPHFESVLGIDISIEQIQAAKNNNFNQNVEFQVVSENLFPLQDDSVELVVCATAAHFLDLNIFVNECNRVLVDGGIVAIFMLLPAEIRLENVQTCLKEEFYSFLMQYFKSIKCHPKNVLCFDGYEMLFGQINNSTKRVIRDISVEKEVTMQDFKRLWSTAGEYQRLMEKEKPQVDPLDVFIAQLKAALGVEDAEDDEIKIFVTSKYPLIILNKE